MSRVEINRERCLARVSGLLIAVTFAAACVSTTPPGGANDPSSAHAESAPAPEVSPVLDEAHAPLPEAAGATRSEGGHDHSGHDHASHGAPSSDHAAQDPSKQQAAMYVCPMHPEVRQGEPGRCPKCGMPLELEKPKTENQ